VGRAPLQHQQDIRRQCSAAARSHRSGRGAALPRDRGAAGAGRRAHRRTGGGRMSEIGMKVPATHIDGDGRAAPRAPPAPAAIARTAWSALRTGRLRAVVLAAGSLAIAFSVWQLLSTFVFNPFLIPPPVAVIRPAIPMLLSGEIAADVSISMVRVLVGFVSGSFAGIVLGVLLGRIRLLHDLLDPIIELLRYLSPTAMIPIAVIWFG